VTRPIAPTSQHWRQRRWKRFRAWISPSRRRGGTSERPFSTTPRKISIAASIIETALTYPIKQRPDIYNVYAAHTVFNRWSSADEVATAVAYLASDAGYVSGSTLFVEGGWTAIDGPPAGLT
jgi:hypothetical protein